MLKVSKIMAFSFLGSLGLFIPFLHYTISYCQLFFSAKSILHFIHVLSRLLYVRETSPEYCGKYDHVFQTWQGST